MKGLNSLIRLSVNLDTIFFDILKKENKQASIEIWENYCKNNGLDNLTNHCLYSNPGQFIDREKIDSLEKNVTYLRDNLTNSISHIHSYFPMTDTEINHELKVTILPYGEINYGPKTSLQLFSIFPDADPYETYLFLIHIYYHEIAFLNYTEYCKECFDSPDSSEKFKHYILTLIQNEGIGNFAVYKELMRFKNENPNYQFKYFTYANDLDDAKKISQSFSLLRQILNDLNDSNFKEYKSKINLILKNKRLPIINLTGTYMANKINEKFGLEKLKNVHKRDALDFFNDYIKTKDVMTKVLLDSNPNYFKEKLDMNILISKQ